MFKNFLGKTEEAPLDNPLEELVATLGQEVETLKEQVAELQAELARITALLSTDGVSAQKRASAMPPSSDNENLSTDSSIASFQEVASENPKTTVSYFLSAPEPDGTFATATSSPLIGKSIYKLSTDNGSDGTFTLLDTPDALSTAVISVSQFIKPACKVEGSLPPMPRSVETLEPGMATFQDGRWQIVKKTVVRFL